MRSGDILQSGFRQLLKIAMVAVLFRQPATFLYIALMQPSILKGFSPKIIV